MMLALGGLALLVACSDDGVEKLDAGKLDAGKLDTSVKDSKTTDFYDPDFTPLDQGPKPDQPKPDADPGAPSKWKETSSSLADALFDVWPVSATNVLAVGKGGLIMKYDGSAWTSMVNPDTNKGALHGIHEGGSNIFALGEGVDLYYDTAGKWNMGYTSTYYSYSFTAVWASTTGTYIWSTDLGSSYPYIRYRSKTSTTSSFSSVYISSSIKPLYGIWGTSDTDIYVVGDAGTIMACTGASSCTTASNWKTVTSPSTSNLRGIWGSSNKDIFAVGYDGVILHYDGSTWTKMTVATSSYFQAVWGSSSSNVYAVGHPIFKSDESIFHYDGTSWTKMPTPHTTFLEGVRGTSASDVWAVGKTHILHYDGK